MSRVEQGAALMVAAATRAKTPEDRSFFRWGIVAQVSPLRVRLDGEDDALDITPESLISARLGDRVRVELSRTTGSALRVIVHGSAGGSSVIALPYGQTTFIDTSLPDDYPVGVTTFTVENNSGTTWPTSWSVVETTKIITARVVQRITDYQGTVHQRTGDGTNAWTAWSGIKVLTAPASYAASYGPHASRPPRVWKDPEGLVHLTGIAQNVVAGTGWADNTTYQLFSLPSGWQPAYDHVTSAYMTLAGTAARSCGLIVRGNAGAGFPGTAGQVYWQAMEARTVTIPIGSLTVWLDLSWIPASA